MRSNSAIGDVVREALAVVLGIEAEAIDASAPLVEYGLDSLKVVELVVELESAIGISFPDENLLAENFENVMAIVRAISGFAPSTSNHDMQHKSDYDR